MLVRCARERAAAEGWSGGVGGEDGLSGDEGGDVVNVAREDEAAAGGWNEVEEEEAGSEVDITGVRARSVRCRARWGCCAGREKEEEAMIDAL